MFSVLRGIKPAFPYIDADYQGYQYDVLCIPALDHRTIVQISQTKRLETNMPTILGFHDSLFDSGATLIRDSEVLVAIQEQRIAGIKHCGGFPWQSIGEVLRVSNVCPTEIDAVAVGCTQHISC